MNILSEKLSDYIKDFPDLIDFLHRLDVPLGFGDKTIGVICREYSIDTFFFTEMLRLIINKKGAIPDNIHRFGLNLTVNYLKNSHKSYLEDYLPKVEHLIFYLKEKEKSREKDSEVLVKYYGYYKSEVIKHLEYEDKTIFPKILKIDEIASSNKINDKTIKWIKKNSITAYSIRHDSLDEKLQDLKGLLIMYMKPFKSYSIVRDLIKTLYDLENDLKLHELIENHILFPQAIGLEESITIPSGK